MEDDARRTDFHKNMTKDAGVTMFHQKKSVLTNKTGDIKAAVISPSWKSPLPGLHEGASTPPGACGPLPGNSGHVWQMLVPSGYVKIANWKDPPFFMKSTNFQWSCSIAIFT